MHKKINILIILINFGFSSVHGMKSETSQKSIKNSYIIVAEKENKFKQYKIDLKDARNHPFLDLYIAFFGDERIQWEELIIGSKPLFDSLSWRDLDSALDRYPDLKSLWLAPKIINCSNELTANSIDLPKEIEHSLTDLILCLNNNELLNVLCINMSLLNISYGNNIPYEKIGNGKFCYCNNSLNDKLDKTTSFYKNNSDSIITAPTGEPIISLPNESFKIADNANIILYKSRDQKNETTSCILFDLETKHHTNFYEILYEDPYYAHIDISPNGRYATISLRENYFGSSFFYLYDISNREKVQCIKEMVSGTFNGNSFFSPDSIKLILMYNRKYKLWDLENIHQINTKRITIEKNALDTVDKIIFNADNEHIFLNENGGVNRQAKQPRFLNIKSPETSKTFISLYNINAYTVHPYVFTNQSDFIVSHQKKSKPKKTIYTKRGIIVDLPCIIPDQTIENMDNTYLLSYTPKSITLWQHAIDGNCQDNTTINYSLKKLMSRETGLYTFANVRLSNRITFNIEHCYDVEKPLLSCVAIPLFNRKDCLPDSLDFSQLGCLLHLSRQRVRKPNPILFNEKHHMKKHFDSFKSNDQDKLKKLLLLQDK